MSSNPTDPGSGLAAREGNAAISNVAATLNGTGFSRSGFDGLYLAGQVGAVSGTPTSFTVIYQLQDGATLGGAYADIAAAVGGPMVLATLLAINTVADASFNISELRAFLRIECTIAFVGVTAPEALIASMAMLGGGRTNPQ